MSSSRAVHWMRGYYRLLATISEQPFKAHHTSVSNRIMEAQKLHAEVYLRHGFIVPDDIGSDQRMHLEADPYQQHSRYFVAVEGEGRKRHVVATARQILAKTDKGHASFPTMIHMELYREYRLAIEHINPEHCVEISGLAKAKGVDTTAVLLLYRTMWHYSLRHDHRVWLMACDASVYSRLRFLFGDALVRIGPNSFYMGSEVVPAMLEVDHSMKPLMRSGRSLLPIKRIMKRELVKFFLTGLADKYKTRLSEPVGGMAELTNEVSE